MIEDFIEATLIIVVIFLVGNYLGWKSRAPIVKQVSYIEECDHTSKGETMLGNCVVHFTDGTIEDVWHINYLSHESMKVCK